MIFDYIKYNQWGVLVLYFSWSLFTSTFVDKQRICLKCIILRIN